MNKVYKVIWSKVKNCYVVASELAKNHTKAPASKVLSKTVVAGILASVINCGAVMPVYADVPTGFTLTSDSSASWFRGNPNVTEEDLFVTGWTASGSTGLTHAGSMDSQIVFWSSPGYAATQPDSPTSFLNVSLDGAFYQHEGQYRVLDIGNAVNNGNKSLYVNNTTGDFAVKYYGVNSADGTNQIGEGAVGPNAIAIGKSALSNGRDAIAIGLNAFAHGLDNIAIGADVNNTNYIESDYSRYQFGGHYTIPDDVQGTTAVGAGSFATATGTSVYGLDSVALTTGSLALGSYSVAKDASYVVSFGHDASDYDYMGNPYGTDLNRRLTHVAEGINNTDVVNVGQLKSYVTPASNGTFINTTNTGGQNLTALDTASKNAIKSVTIDGNMLVYTKGDNSSVSVALPTGSGSGSGATVPNGVARTTTVGSVTAFASNSTPSGYLLCDGRAVSRTEYAALFEKIGTTYGAGDGSTTFNLPNLVGRFVEGSTASGQYVGAGLPNITGWFEAADDNSGNYYGGVYGGAFNNTGTIVGNESGGPGQQSVLDFDASRSNPLYGRSNTVQPESLMMQYYIKTNDDASASRYVGINSESGGFNEWGEGAVGADAIAIGKNAVAETSGGVAIGNNAHIYATQDNGAGQNLAIGDSAVSYGGMAIGQHTQVGTFENRGNNSVAVGTGTKVYGKNSVGLGVNALIDTNLSRATALGTDAHVTANNAVALGAGSVASANNVISVGHTTSNTDASGIAYDSDLYRKIVNVADGVNDHDVATVGQVNARTAYYGVNGSFVPWTDANAEELKLKYNVQTKEEYEALIESGLNINGEKATGVEAIAIGVDAEAISSQAIAIGSISRANNSQAVSIGHGANSLKNYDGTDRFGNAYALDIGESSVAIGAGSASLKNSSIAIGHDTVANGDHSLALGSYSVSREPFEVSFGHDATDVDFRGTAYGTTINRRLTHVADGINNNDAVTVGQLKNNITPASNGTFITTTNTGGQNLTSLDNASKNAIKSVTVDGNMLVYTKGDNSSVSVALPTGSGSGGGVTVPNGVARTTTVGSVTAFASNSTPTGYLLCDGRAVSRTQYADLFAKIGTTYGAGDGSTTFNLPNLVNRFVEGSNASGQYINAGLPNITGTIREQEPTSGSYDSNFTDADTFPTTGAFGAEHQERTYYNGVLAERGQQSVLSGITFDASKSNSIYGNSNTVQPNSLKMQYYIKTNDEAPNSRYIGINSDSGYLNEWGDGATGTDAIAIGKKASSSATNAVALGTDSVANEENTVSVGNSSIKRRIVNVADGTTATDSATVGQTLVLENGVNSVVTANGTNTIGQPKYKVDVAGNGTIAENDTGLVSGGTLYNEVHLGSDGTYVKQNRTTARNIRELDAQIASNDGDIAQNASSITNLRDLSNITEAGQTVIKNLSKGSVNVKSGTNSEVVKSTENDVDVYTVNVLSTGVIAQDNTGVVSGGTVYNALTEKADVNALNVTNAEAWADKLGTGIVSASDTKLVTGKTVAEETRIVSDGNYILKDNTIAENIFAVDSQVKQNANAIATNTTDIANLKNLSNLTDDGKTVIKNLSKGSVNVIGSGKAVVTKSDVDGVDTYDIKVNSNGVIAENNEDLVTGGTVYSAIQDAISASETDITTQLNRKANRDASNINNIQPWAEKLGVGTIDEGDTNLVTGKTVAEETRIASDGNYVLQTNTAGQNIIALDTQVKANADAITTLQTTASDMSETKANVGLDNISNSGQTVIRELAKDSVKVIDGVSTSVTEGTDGDTKTYAVNIVKDGIVAEGNEGVVTGGTVYEAIENVIANSEAGTATALEGKANVDASNVTNSSAWANKLNTGAVAEGNRELVSGGKVYTAIQTAKSEVTDAINDLAGDIGTTLETKANVSLDNINEDGKTVIRNLAKNAVSVANGVNTTVSSETDANGNVIYKVNATGTGEVQFNDTRLVNGDTVTKAIVNAVGNVMDYTNDGFDKKAEKDASNVADYAEQWGESIGIGAVAKNNKELVTGGTMYTELRPVNGNYVLNTNTTAQNISALDTQVKSNSDSIENLQNNTSTALNNKANTNLDNLTTEGETVVRNLAKDAVKVIDGTYTTVVKGTEENATTYAVNVVADGIVETGNTGIVTGGTVKEAIDTLSSATDTKLEEYAKKDASNVTDASAWANAIGTGEVASDNTELVTGEKVYTAIHNAVDTAVTDIQGSLTDKANTNLDNLTSDGETVIRTITKDAVKVADGTNTSVSSETDANGNITYKVNAVANGTVAEGDTGLVSGDTVYDAVMTMAEVTGTELAGKANVDASNITDADAWGEKIATGIISDNEGKAVSGKTVYTAIETAKTELGNTMNTALADYAKKDASNIQVSDWATKLGTGTVATNDTNLVTGDTIAREVRIAEDGNYVRKDNTVAQNLNSIDTVLKETRDMVDSVTASESNSLHYDDASKGKVTLAGSEGTIITNLKDGDLSENSTDAVTGKQLFETNQQVQANTDAIQSVNDKLGTVTEGSYVSNDKTFGENLNALDTQVKANTDSITEIQETMGGIVSNMDSKLNTDLSNLSETGTDTIRDLAQKSIEAISNDGSVIITKTDAEGVGKGRTFDFSVKKDGVVAEGNNDIVTGDAVYQAIQNIDMPEETNYVGVNSQDNEDMNYHGGGATGDNAVAIGVGTTSSGEEAVAIGHGATVSGLQSIAVGTKNQVSGNHSGAFGDPNDVSGDGSYAVGNDNTISSDNTFVFGNNVEATGSNSVVLGNNSDGSQDNVVSVGRNGNERKIVHVADGEISANSKDAINGSQLFKVAEDFANAQNINVDEWTNALATGTISEGDGGLVTGGQVYDVAKNLGNSFSDLIAPDVSGTQIRLGGGAIYDGVDTINIAKSNGEGRVMTGVITDPSDLNSAANVGYVNAIGQNVLNAANSAIQDVSTKANKIGASAAAMASLEAPPMDGDEKWAFSAAVGHYEGETAGAVGAFYRPQDNVIVNVRGSVGNGEDMIGAGVGVALQRGNTPSVSKAQLVRTINAQAGKIKEQDNRIAELESQVATMMEMFKQQQQNNVQK